MLNSFSLPNLFISFNDEILTHPRYLRDAVLRLCLHHHPQSPKRPTHATSDRPLCRHPALSWCLVRASSYPLLLGAQLHQDSRYLLPQQERLRQS